jgi:3-hydroxyacyl-[acyl-carrier-protein] dehydratase
MIEKQDIKRYLPHREPFLFVDGVTEIIKDEYIKGFKEVREEEYYFKGHFPDNPILPGVIIIEALAQVSGILGFVTMNKTPEEGSIYYFVGADNVRFRSPVVPPSILTLESKKIQDRRGIWKFDCKASLEENLVCSATILCADRPK